MTCESGRGRNSYDPKRRPPRALNAVEKLAEAQSALAARCEGDFAEQAQAAKTEAIAAAYEGGAAGVAVVLGAAHGGVGFERGAVLNREGAFAYAGIEVGAVGADEEDVEAAHERDAEAATRLVVLDDSSFGAFAEPAPGDAEGKGEAELDLELGGGEGVNEEGTCSEVRAGARLPAAL